MTLTSTCNVQGAAEIVLKRCVSIMDDIGSVVPISGELRAKLEDTVTSMASTELPNEAQNLHVTLTKSNLCRALPSLC